MEFETRLSAENAAQRLMGKTVLLVDESADTRMLFRFILEEQGAEVIAAMSVTEALVAIEHVNPHLLISDIILGGEDGYSLLHRVRSLNLGRLQQIPAIAISGLYRKLDSLHTASAEFQLYLTKPVDPDELLTAAVALTQPAAV